MSEKNIKEKKFSDYRKEILSALNKKIETGELSFSEPVTLFEGFFMQPVQNSLEGMQLGGKSIPMIVLIGSSGKMYYLALKKILPEVEI